MPTKAAPKVKRKPRKSAPAEPPPPEPKPQPIHESTILIHTKDAADIPLAAAYELKSMAMRWAYVVRNRVRWTGDSEALKSVRKSATDDLAAMGLDADRLKTLAKADVVEVVIPFQVEEEGWEARILPWEFLLSAATWGYRNGRPLVVIRRMQMATTPSPRNGPGTLAAVASLPGRLKKSGYEFESELALVQSNSALKGPPPILNPTLTGLANAIQQSVPDVVHLAGIDLHQGYQILGISETRGDRIKDGYYLAADDGGEFAASSFEIAQAVNSGATKPMLVSCNVYNSAARTAALIVAQGAEAAIGFQDEIDDLLAEQFFTRFYRAWRELGWDLLRAFRAAFRDLAGEPTTGTGVVLWTRNRLLDVAAATTVRQDEETLRVRRSATGGGTGDVTKDLTLDVKTVPSINYALLHNNQPLFKTFCLRNMNKDLAMIRRVRLQVELCVGDQTYPFRTMLDLEAGSPLELKTVIRTPLTSTLFRSLRESVQSVLFVKISAEGTDVMESTYPVRLLAIDEWVDETQLNAFLPSFVLSRDPCVLKVIDAAQRHLMTLTDDPGAGFDGYQGVNLLEPDSFESVDLQVWAIWSCLCNDFGISYINPPPTFTEHSQRLRSPSDVIEGHRGTCIDLMLLFAACLEYVGIYPVLFLLRGHAFPGYWRSEQGREKFVQARTAPDANATVEEARKGSSPYPWLELQQSYDEVLNLVRQGDLAPLETVWLTQHKGFWEARDGGLENLRSRAEFDSMIDVEGARKQDVTPLPVTRG